MRLLKWVFPLSSLILMGANCANIKYQDDVGFLNSAQANNPEFPATINGIFCKDSGGFPGMCSIRIKSNQDVVIHLDPRPYQYTLTLSCTSAINESQSFTVPPDIAFDYTIKSAKFSTVESFLCIGEVSPTNRPGPVSAEFEFRIKIVDVAYIPRETPYVVNDKLIMGEHSKFVNICDKDSCREYQEKPVVMFKGDVSAYSESLLMRFNYYGK